MTFVNDSFLLPIHLLSGGCRLMHNSFQTEIGEAHE